MLGLILVLLVGCGASWQAEVLRPDGTALTLNSRFLGEQASFAEKVDGQPAVPLERILAQAGHRAVERVVLVGADGTRRELLWAEMDGRAWWRTDGQVQVGAATWSVQHVEAVAPELLGQVEVEIVDLAPTAAVALGLPLPAQATGRVLPLPPAGHALIVLLDGLGYLRYQEAAAAGQTPHLSGLGEPRLGLTAYPPVTVVATAALLTGAPPAVNGVDRRGIRTTAAQTLLEVVSAAGGHVVAVEGAELPFNLPGAEIRLSGDGDGDGHTDDNVLGNALAVLQEGMPDLFFVHFHGIDDAGHTYGPGSPEQDARIVAVDRAVGDLLAALPPDVLVIVLADHGMHPVREDGRRGDHGTLCALDMFVPVWIVAP